MHRLLLALVCATSLPAAPERWFMPGPLGHEPADGPVAASSSAASAAPGFGLRVFFGLARPEEAAWRQANGVTDTPDNLHGLFNFFGPKLHAEHPEYFPLVQGKRYVPRAGSTEYNPDLGREDVAAYTAAQVQAYFQANPAAPFSVIGINDGLIFGESPETLALTQPTAYYAGRPDYSRLVFTFLNRVAAITAATHPDKYLACLAYYWTENPPPFPVDPHLIPFVAVDRSQAYEPAYARELTALHQRWAKALGLGQKTVDGGQRTVDGGQKTEDGGQKTEGGGRKTVDGGRRAEGSESGPSQISNLKSRIPSRVRLGLYDYLYGNGFIVPRLPVRTFARQLQEAHALGYTDYFAEVSPNWGLAGPLPWLMAQLLEQPQQSVDALLDEYYRRFWKTAAKPMRAFFERCEAQWMQQSGPAYWLKHYRNESQAALFPPAVCAELRLLLDAAATAAGTDATLQQRVAFVSDSFRVTERFVTFDATRQELARFALQPGRVSGAAARLLARYLRERAAFREQLQQTGSRWPLAFFPNPWNYDDFLRHHPAFPAALVLAREGLTHDLRALGDGEIRDALALGAALRAGPLKEVARNGALAGPLVKGRRIAGLTYGADLPAPWLSQLEPTQHGVATIKPNPETHDRPGSDRPGSAGVPPASVGSTPAADRSLTASSVAPPAILRMSGATNSTVFQWVPIKGGQLYLASVLARGKVTLGNATTLTLGWLDAQQRPVGVTHVSRLPEGTWPDWVPLTQGARAPETAAWAGLGVRVQSQLGADYVEFQAFSLKTVE